MSNTTSQRVPRDATSYQALIDAGHQRVPLCTEIAADLDTPLAVYTKLAQQSGSFILESVEQGERWGRYSIIGLPCSERLEIRGLHYQHLNGEEVLADREVTDPLAEVQAFIDQQQAFVGDDLPQVGGGLFGYFGHDTVRYVEPRLAKSGFSPNPDALNTPDILLLVCDELVVFDRLRHSMVVIVYGRAGQAFATVADRSREIVRQIREGRATLPSPAGSELSEADFVSGFPEADFKAAVGKAKQYIHDGDIMQVVPSQRLSAPFNEAPVNLYRALRRLNPSPYMYFFDFGEFQVVGSSPEILVKLEDREVTVRPIAGTRRRGRTEAEDKAMEAELLADPKERAEHLMLIDLGRNDVGRVAETGTVQLTAKMIIERYSHVMHIVSNVKGRLKDGLTAIDALRATFPAGTLSGAPKIRALEIIDELEPVKRGIYGGAVGYIGWNGNMDTAIAIRTAVIKDGQIHVQAGAGLVADSVPELEWKETMNKAKAMMQAASEAGEEI